MSASPDWRDIVDAAPEGVVVCDAAGDHPVLYANRAFAQMCGQPVEALLGANLRTLQGIDRDQQARQNLREALECGAPCRALLRNYRPDGSLFWNEVMIQPVRDAEGRLTQWVSYHRDVSERQNALQSGLPGRSAAPDDGGDGAFTGTGTLTGSSGFGSTGTFGNTGTFGSTGTLGGGGAPGTAGGSSGGGWASATGTFGLSGGLAGVPGLPAWMREDRLTALSSRAYFEELLRRGWQLAQRDSHEIGLTLFDIDDLSAYNDTFDKIAGDACIRRVARAISNSYRRGSDLVSRWEGGTFAVLTQGEAAAHAGEYAKVVVQRVRDLLIHHPRAANGSRYVTLSAGVASLVPARELPIDALLAACLSALKRAKSIGKNHICAAEARDFKA